MTLDDVLKKSKEIERSLKGLVDGLSTDVEKVQRQLAEMLLETFGDTLDVDSKKLLFNVTNIAATSTVIDTVFSQAYKDKIGPLLRQLGTGLEMSYELAFDYYRTMGYGVKDLKGAAKQISVVRSLIGIEANGKLVPDGYLSRLGQSQSVKETLKKYVLNAVVNEASLAGFNKGFNVLMKGNTGVLASHWRQYAYDTFNQVHEIGNRSIATSIGLGFFIYEGSIIDTSREFCRKRAGEVFHITETATWKNDPDLVDKKSKDSYQPLIERGRYNCRHTIRYISDELAIRLRPDAEKFK